MKKVIALQSAWGPVSPPVSQSVFKALSTVSLPQSVKDVGAVLGTMALEHPALFMMISTTLICPGASLLVTGSTTAGLGVATALRSFGCVLQTISALHDASVKKQYLSAVVKLMIATTMSPTIVKDCLTALPKAAAESLSPYIPEAVSGAGSWLVNHGASFVEMLKGCLSQDDHPVIHGLWSFAKKTFQNTFLLVGLKQMFTCLSEMTYASTGQGEFDADRFEDRLRGAMTTSAWKAGAVIAMLQMVPSNFTVLPELPGVVPLRVRREAADNVRGSIANLLSAVQEQVTGVFSTARSVVTGAGASLGVLANQIAAYLHLVDTQTASVQAQMQAAVSGVTPDVVASLNQEADVLTDGISDVFGDLQTLFTGGLEADPFGDIDAICENPQSGAADDFCASSVNAVKSSYTNWVAQVRAAIEAGRTDLLAYFATQLSSIVSQMQATLSRLSAALLAPIQTLFRAQPTPPDLNPLIAQTNQFGASIGFGPTGLANRVVILDDPEGALERADATEEEIATVLGRITTKQQERDQQIADNDEAETEARSSATLAEVEAVASGMGLLFGGYKIWKFARTKTPDIVPMIDAVNQQSRANLWTAVKNGWVIIPQGLKTYMETTYQISLDNLNPNKQELGAILAVFNALLSRQDLYELLRVDPAKNLSIDVSYRKRNGYSQMKTIPIRTLAQLGIGPMFDTPRAIDHYCLDAVRVIKACCSGCSQPDESVLPFAQFEQPAPDLDDYDLLFTTPPQLQPPVIVTTGPRASARRDRSTLYAVGPMTGDRENVTGMMMVNMDSRDRPIRVATEQERLEQEAQDRLREYEQEADLYGNSETIRAAQEAARRQGQRPQRQSAWEEQQGPGDGLYGNVRYATDLVPADEFDDLGIVAGNQDTHV